MNVGMVGYKFMGKAHSHAYKDVGMFFDMDADVVMKAICGRDEQGVKEAADKFGWESYETDWRKMVARDDIDLVDINAPSDAHKEITLAAIAAGKHVFCEKPLALNLADGREMLEAAEKAGIRHAVCFNYRFLPAVQLAKKLIDDGKIGDIHHYRATYLQDWLVDPGFPLAWRLKKEVAGSGAHGDLNAHCIDLARFLIGEFDRVVGHNRTFVKERPIPASSSGLSGTASADIGEVTVDDATGFLADFKNGAMGSFIATRFAAGRKNGNTFEIHGSKGSIRWDLERLNELEVYFREDEPNEAGFRRILVTESTHKYAGNWWPTGHIIGYEHAFVHIVYEFVQHIAQGTPFAPTFLDGVRCQEVLEAVDLSIERGSWVSVSEV
ncbi:gfo/Idh/MocA family oxidoreductase [Cohnella sp. CFH 77786]|uniref:Gfo/Idh/MocA family protein n=1 Tax=Cohnella sp. CFH 77786 TaxID=2662265 RepID=UPI001C6088E8|nr:Gfo/Idh/MocA family oxidoreductase [Cohnella sp. CFH 77786]MBW5449124.1 gfo/Idh/MocA family oxidoreductase [Cohnella sp. CFH 77786]